MNRFDIFLLFFEQDVFPGQYSKVAEISVTKGVYGRVYSFGFFFFFCFFFVK